MTVLTGCEGLVYLYEVENDPLVFVGEINSWSISYSLSADEFRPLGQYYPNRGISAADWSFSFSGYLDPTDPGQTLLNAGKLLYFKIYPEGDDEPTKPAAFGRVYVESVDTSGSPEELVSLSFNGTGSSLLETENWNFGD